MQYSHVKAMHGTRIYLLPWHVAIAFMEATSTGSDVLGPVRTGQSSHRLKEMNLEKSQIQVSPILGHYQSLVSGHTSCLKYMRRAGD